MTSSLRSCCVVSVLMNIHLLAVQCAKALVYFDMQLNLLKVNAANEHGDSPLHLASRWGYGEW